VLGADGIGCLLREYIRDELGQEDLLGTHLETEGFA
jgi:hypothetical protein